MYTKEDIIGMVIQYENEVGNTWKVVEGGKRFDYRFELSSGSIVDNEVWTMRFFNEKVTDGTWKIVGERKQILNNYSIY